MSKDFPDTLDNVYNHKLKGFYGEFMPTKNSKIFYVQSGLPLSELKKINLVSDIPHSERWSIQDLFQREIDDERVNSEILTYLNNENSIKYFNPLTLILLPLKPDDARSTQMTHLEWKSKNDGNNDWEVLEWEGKFRFRYIVSRHYFAEIDWHDNQVVPVAIDGQHRLCALKKFMLDPRNAEKIDKWIVPVIILGLKSEKSDSEENDLLHVIRNIFIYINKEAKKPSRAREILLSEQSITSICSQEWLQYSHANDVKDIADRDQAIVPLMFYDWREPLSQKGNQKTRSACPAAIKSVEEIHDWLSFYIIGYDGKPGQCSALGIEVNDELYNVFKPDVRLEAGTAKKLRETFKKNLLPSLNNLMENFTPYKKYIESLVKMEKELTTGSHISMHAFTFLRFGKHGGLPQDRENIETKMGKIIDNLTDLKEKYIPEILSYDIGMRGIMFAFGNLKQYYVESIGKNVGWEKYSKWFVQNLNTVYDSGWFYEKKDQHKQLLRHVIRNEIGDVSSTGNYKLEKAQRAFGAFLSILISAYGHNLTKHPTENVLKTINDRHRSNLLDTIATGYRREIRPKYKDLYPNDDKKAKQQEKIEADSLAEAQMSKFDKAIEKIKKS